MVYADVYDRFIILENRDLKHRTEMFFIFMIEVNLEKYDNFKTSFTSYQLKKPHYSLWPCWHSEDRMVALASWLLWVCYCRNLIPAYIDTAADLGKVFPELNGKLPSMTPPPRHNCQIPSGQKVMEQESARPTNVISIASVTSYFLWYLCACLLSHFSHVWLCVTPGTVACRAPLSMAFSRQEY